MKLKQRTTKDGFTIGIAPTSTITAMSPYHIAYDNAVIGYCASWQSVLVLLNIYRQHPYQLKERVKKVKQHLINNYCQMHDATYDIELNVCSLAHSLPIIDDATATAGMEFRFVAGELVMIEGVS